MALMLSETYKALLEAGASEEQATKAASELASYDSRLSEMKSDLTVVRGDVALLKWMIGFNLAMTTAILFKIFT